MKIEKNRKKINFEELEPGDVFFCKEFKTCMKIYHITSNATEYNFVILENGEVGYCPPKGGVSFVRGKFVEEC